MLFKIVCIYLLTTKLKFHIPRDWCLTYQLLARRAKN